MVKIEEVNYKTFGRCVRIANETAEVFVTVDFGPRIIRYALLGKENIMKEDTEFKNCHSGGLFDEMFGKGSVWYIRGGHRLWFSPEQSPACCYPDNTPVKYEKIENGIRLLCDKQRVTNLRYIIDVTLDENNSAVEVNHTIFNENIFDIEIAAWALSVTDVGGMCVLPVPQTDTGLLPNRSITLWPYAKMSDERVFFGDDYITVSQDPKNGQKFKIGLTNEDGFALVFNHGCMFVKEYAFDENAPYPDNGVNSEIYTDSGILECESLSPLYVIAPQQAISHTEIWHLYGDIERPGAKDEKLIDEYVKKYVL